MTKRDVPTVGKLITESEERDAIHIAIAPVVANTNLYPGEHIGFCTKGEFEKVDAKEGTKKIGIVDPFLIGGVKRGQQFWMFLYPNTITALKHNWSHPAFVEKPAGVEVVKKNETEPPLINMVAYMRSRAWLEKLAEEVEMSFEDLVEAGREYNATGEFCTIGIDTPSRVYDEVGTFWEHYKVVTGEEVRASTDTIFSCAC